MKRAVQERDHQVSYICIPKCSNISFIFSRRLPCQVLKTSPCPVLPWNGCTCVARRVAEEAMPQPANACRSLKGEGLRHLFGSLWALFFLMLVILWFSSFFLMCVFIWVLILDIWDSLSVTQVSNLCVLQLYDYQAAVCTFDQELYRAQPAQMPWLYYAQRPSQTLANAALNWRLNFADVLVFWLASYSLDTCLNGAN